MIAGMADFLHVVITTYAALFPICNPLGNAAVFLSMTEGEKRATRKEQALKGSIFVFLILGSFLLLGTFILNFFEISLSGVRVAGGFVVAMVGTRLLTSPARSEQQDSEKKEAIQKPDISFTPLALPLLAGPGSIAVVMTRGTLNADFFTISASMVGILLLAVTCWLILREADRLLAVIGVNGANALTKIMAFLLLCIGVQLMINGVKGAFLPA